MGSAGKAWMIAASIGAVEALMDQLGFCRWNYTPRSLHQQAKNNLRSISQAKKLSSSVVSSSTTNIVEESEESLRTVMYLSCWGPNIENLKPKSYSIARPNLGHW